MSPLPVSLPFADRSEAGRQLAERVRAHATTDPIVLALPRGGVPVGAELARALSAPLDVVMVRKVGMPGHPELGVGAVTEDGQVCFDDRALARLGVSRDQLMATVRDERAELGRRLEVYRGARSAPRLEGRDVIVVDDGVATGGTARAALRMVRRRGPARLVLAIPVGSQLAVEALRPEVDHVVVMTAPENFRAVGEWYRDFGQLTDDRVTALLQEYRDPGSTTDRGRAVRLRAGDVDLDGELSCPPDPPGSRGAVILAFGSEHQRARHRESAVAAQHAGFATLLLDLLTPDEEARQASGEAAAVTPEELATRLEEATPWLRREVPAPSAPLGLFGSGTAAPAALMVAARSESGDTDIGAVVTHGGRIDRAEDSLPQVRAPTLVLVEGDDSFVRELAEWAVSRLGAPHDLRVVAGAEQLLGSSEAWHEVSDAIVGWFERHV